jgi:hypothetical protein
VCGGRGGPLQKEGFRGIIPNKTNISGLKKGSSYLVPLDTVYCIPAHIILADQLYRVPAITKKKKVKMIVLI